MTTMTFESFQASRGYVEDYVSPEGDWTTPAMVYDTGLVIEVLSEGGLAGKSLYCLTIANELYSDTGSDGLERLERKLYDWAKDEGYFD